MTRPFAREALLQSIDTLPVLPTVLTEVMQLDARSDDYFERLTGLAEHDPLFAARVIRLANSASFQGRDPALTVRNAVTRLGTRAVADVLVSFSVIRVFVPRTPPARELWVHALQVALAARDLAYASGADVDPEMLYLAGLLHDLGRFIMLDVARPTLDDVENRGFETPSELVEAEVDLCGIDHARLGARAAKAWGLPDVLCAIIRDHHRDVQTMPRATRAPLELLQLADALSMCIVRADDHEPDVLEAIAARRLAESTLDLTARAAAKRLRKVRRAADAILDTLHV